MKRVKQPVICNAKGEPIVLTPAEKYHCEYMQRKVNRRFKNAIGYEIPITTLTSVVKKVAEAKYFQVAPADYVPIRVGEGAWSTNITTFRSFDVADEFENGMINTGGQNARLATADAAIDAINVRVNNWAKMVGWSIFDLEFAAQSGNWDIVASKEKARKRNWDLGIQRVAFLGARSLNGAGGSVLGLLNQPGITVDTTAIPQSIGFMSVTALKTFTGVLIERFRANCQRTCWPNRFIVPESDYNSLASQASPDFPIKSTLELLEDTLKSITHNRDFKILPNPYGDNSFSGLGFQQYVLLNADEDSIRMDIPVDYTNTLANSIDNFSFQNVSYGQFTGVQVYRPLEIIYFQHAAGV